MNKKPGTGGRPGPKKPRTPRGRAEQRRREPGILDFDIRIVYEDDTVIVIDKPAGLLSVATAKETGRTAFKVVRDYLTYGTWRERQARELEGSRSEGAYLGVVHRLDRETSGIMLFVKTPEARERLTRDWQNQVSDRRYLAVVEGAPPQDEGTVRNWLRQNKAFVVYALDRPEPGAEEAITHYRLVSRVEAAGSKPREARSLVELRLETGRTNQIRVHMAGLGCPLVGDRKYGRPDARGRLALHARRIVFTHPADGRTMTFESPLPPELKRMIRGLPADQEKAD